MVEGVMIFLSTCALVFARAIQQQNVIGGHYLAATITPYFIALAEAATVLIVVQHGLPMVPWMGTGGAIGATSAMYLHRRVYKRDSNK